MVLIYKFYQECIFYHSCCSYICKDSNFMPKVKEILQMVGVDRKALLQEPMAHMYQNYRVTNFTLITECE